MLAVIVGTLIGSIIVMKLKRVKAFIVLLSVVTVVSTAYIVQVPEVWMYVLCVFNGMFRSVLVTILMSYPIFFKEKGPKYAGTTGGIIGTFQVIGAVVISAFLPEIKGIKKKIKQ